MVESQNKETGWERRCNGCGKLPRRPASGEFFPLQRCSRCRNAWYHDSACQKNHFPEHRKICRKIASSSSDKKKPQQLTKSDVSPTFLIDKREHRGRCLLASRQIHVGGILAPSNLSEFFKPLVPPVLNENNRSKRCALCYGILEAAYMYDENKHIAIFPVIFCSIKCREQGRPWLFQEEVSIVDFFSATFKEGMRSPLRILPTAILLYRLLYRIVVEESEKGKRGREVSTSSRLEDLQSHDTNIAADAREHAATIGAIALELMRISAHHVGMEQEVWKRFSVDYISRVVSKIKTNGFSICDGESVALGIGIFPVASNCNHSCQPNAIQTFEYGQCGSLPCLRVTACSPIAKGSEICISYIDSACPRNMRREALKHSYNFVCTCSKCSDDETETRVVGLRCPRVECCGLGIWQPVAKKWQCSECGETKYEKAQLAIKKFKAIAVPDVPDRSHIKQLNKVYTTFKASCCFKSSWYVRETGERLVQCYLDCLSSSTSESDTRDLCSQALFVLIEILSSYTDDTANVEECTTVRINILRYKAAKLRLFLVPDPRQALLELQQVYTELALYFPLNHELIVGIKQCMEQASV